MEILENVPDELFEESVLDVELDLVLLSDWTTTDSHQEAVLSEVLEWIVDDVIFGYCLEIHRMCRYHIFDLEDTDTESSKEFAIVDTPGLDIFGQLPMKKSLECPCPNCGRNMAASRFAPHLEKCMGMGRCSSRVASRRIANNISKDVSDTESLPGDTNDNEWSVYGEKKAKKIKREKHNNSPRSRGRPPNKTRNVEAASGELLCETVLANMSPEDRRTLLQNICGVISDLPSRKMCTRAVRCTQHTEEQKQAARNILLAESKLSSNDDDVHIDIDTYDDIDSQSLRESLWDKEMTPNVSPADSTSTVNSSGASTIQSSGSKRGSRKGRHRE